MNSRGNIIMIEDIQDIQPEFFKRKKQVVDLVESMICKRDLAYIPRIMFHFDIRNLRLSQLNADMRKIEIICEIIMSESMFSDGRLIFLEKISSYKELIEKYIYITLLLRRLEFEFPEDILEDTTEALINGFISVCAIRKIIDCEIFGNPEYVYNRALQIIGGNEIE